MAEEVRAQPEALRAGPWMLDCADDPHALPDPRELRKDIERTLKVCASNSRVPAPCSSPLIGRSTRPRVPVSLPLLARGTLKPEV